MEKALSQVEKYILYTTVFLFPFFILPISPNPFVVPKLALLSLALILILLTRSIKVILSGKLDFSFGNFDLSVFLLAAAYIASTILRTPNKMEAYLLPGTTTAIVGGALLYYFINQLKESEKNVISMLLFGSAAVFSALSLLALSGVLSKIPQLPAFMKASGFTPEGGYLPALVFLGVMLPIGIGHFFSEREMSKRTLLGVSTAVVIFGLAVSIYQLLPGRPFSPRFPSFATSWSIAVDAMKGSPIFGVGPGNYLTAFNRFRPLSYNSSDLWAIKFTTARDFYLTTLTETGMLGFAAIALLLVTLYNTAKKDVKEKKVVNWGFAASSTLIALILLTIALLFIPATLLLIVLFFVLLSLNSKVKHTSLNLTTQGASDSQGLSSQSVASRFPALLVTLPVIIFVGLFTFRSYKIVLAEYKFQKALNLLVKNDASGTYDTMRAAIQLNNQVDRYHATFARVNLALANAIAQKASTNGPDGKPVAITDQDRSNITLLIQQAIAEGKATVALNPLRSGNWEILGQVYRSITGLAQGADQFSVQTYSQAVALDPINPNLRIALGGVYYSKKDYENAAKVFELAASAKPDLANAHYNYSLSLRDNNQLDKAISEMTLVLSQITDKNSKDYQLAKKTLEDMQAKKKAAAPIAGEQLTSPVAGQGANLKPPVKLPEGSEPPASIVTQTPAVTPTTVPTTEGGLPLSPAPTR